MDRIHKDEIIRFANSKENTKVWCKQVRDNTCFWSLSNTPLWSGKSSYVVDDEYATVRKFFIDEGYIWQNTGVGGWFKHKYPTWDSAVENYSTAGPKWYELESSIGKPIWVWDENEEDAIASDFLKYEKAEEYSFYTSKSSEWRYARPVQVDDLIKEEN